MTSPAYQEIKDRNGLPSPSGVALEILRLAADENVAVEKLVTVVESDPAMTGRILKLVNSPFTGISRKIASISIATKMLGVRTVKNLALALSLVSNHRSGPCKGFDYGTFWSESLARAVAANALANHLKNLPAGEAFTVGLLAKVGRLGLATAYPEEYSQVMQSLDDHDLLRLADRERELFSLDHNDLAAEMLADWGLPEVFCDAVRRQDSPDLTAVDSGPRSNQLARLLRWAGTIASSLIHPQTRPASLTLPIQEAAAHGISLEAFQQLFESLVAEWHKTGAILSITTRAAAPLEETDATASTDPHSGARHHPQPGPPSAVPIARREPLRILAVDDDPAILSMIKAQLTAEGYKVITATSGTEAFKIDLEEAPQMIITDWMMPQMDGLEFCRMLRLHGELGFVYVIILTAHTDRERVVEALQAGADDHLAKPWTRDELIAHVRAGERIARLEAELRRRSLEISQYNAELIATNEKLREIATTDELTGLSNRREGLARLEEHWALAVRHADPLSCIIADIDHFKNLNDTHGHAVGDVVLRETARVLRQPLRAGELVSRIGGEEFLVLCPKSPAEAAQQAAERLRCAIESNTIRCKGMGLSVTISLGVADRTESMQQPEDLLRAADEALFAAKRVGRNRVCVAGQRLLVPTTSA
ncbi:MAG TPA: HDOD domain-containing protein [Phycisphaerae bacterium]|nr:HDOD domain-containing protein [Phycisphaerae bacterium]